MPAEQRLPAQADDLVARAEALAAGEEPAGTASPVQNAVLKLLRLHGQQTDDQLWDRYRDAINRGDDIPFASPQSVRTRRHELAVAGDVRPAGRGRSRYGRTATIWALTAQGAQYTEGRARGR